MSVFKIHHITRYTYDRPVKDSCNEIKIYPYPDDCQEIIAHEVNISHQPEVNIYTDYWGNKSGYLQVAQPHSEIVIDSRLTIRTKATTPNTNQQTAKLCDLTTLLSNDLMLVECAYPDAIQNTDAIKKIISSLNIENKTIFEIVSACNQYIFEHFTYTKGITNVETTVDEILATQAGVCQDFAHVMLQVLRTLRIPCRYVSGYICPNKNGMRGEGATHAWVEAYLPNYGWAGIDPTNNVWVANNHIKLAVGRHFIDCSPVKGVFKGPASQQLSVYVSVGYEDGHIFEELNKVNMEIIAEDGQKTVVTNFVLDTTRQQHEQQQQ